MTRRQSVVLWLLVLTSPLAAQTNVSGIITADTTWSMSGSPYILTGDVTVRQTTGAIPTLTIEPGVEVQLNDRALQLGDPGGSNYPGILDAEGVTFTGTGSNARVRFFRGAGQRLAGCEFLGAFVQSGAGSGTISNIYVDAHNSSYGIIASGTWTITAGIVENALSKGIVGGGMLTISNVTIRNCGGSGLDFGGMGSTISASNLNIVDNGTYGVSLDNCSGTVSGCVISGHTYPYLLVGGNSEIGGNDISGNTNLAIATFGVIALNTTWRASWGMPKRPARCPGPRRHPAHRRFSARSSASRSFPPRNSR
ncbi:MAG: right-handed parallel beta-helix repeat-containing protein [Phycisphaerales bacterium]|nr:right-handed parallel beta-helix repeat-containing protein [Phycisphaerales bacterium]